MAAPSDTAPARIRGRLAYFQNNSNNFCGSAQGVLFAFERRTCEVPVPVVLQVNIPPRTSPEYIFSEFWIFRPSVYVNSQCATLSALDTTSISCPSTQCSYTAYYLRQSLLSTSSLRRNLAVSDLANVVLVPRGDVLVVKFSLDRLEGKDINMQTDGASIKLLLERMPTMLNRKLPPKTSGQILDLCKPQVLCALSSTSTSLRDFVRSYYSIRLSTQLSFYVNNPILLRSTMNSSNSFIIGSFVLSFLNLVPNSNFPLLIAGPRDSRDAWRSNAAAEGWVVEYVDIPHVFEDYCGEYMAYRTSKGRRIRILLSKSDSAIYFVLGFSNVASLNILTSDSLYMPYPKLVLRSTYLDVHWSPYFMPSLLPSSVRRHHRGNRPGDTAHDKSCCPAVWRSFTDSATWNLRWGGCAGSDSCPSRLELSARWNFAYIQEIIAFNMASVEQESILSLIERHLQTGLLCDWKDVDPLRLLVSGPAGVGKFTLVQSIAKLFKERLSEDLLLITTPTSVAAAHIGGIPLQHWVNTATLSNEQRNTLRVAKYLIVNDVCLCSADVLRRILDAFASAHGLEVGDVEGQAFNGVNVIVLGDLVPDASSTGVGYAEENIEGGDRGLEDRDWLAMANDLAAFARLNFK
ncbi:hypothetical protein BT96DRAFT_1002266 [Gymnopus androsaceus JB14]|uniref:ATP-dependent DNA helicase n=1 Tax=Gymnopus androsaceus JB14 TaxID=1447944 RepID=A0A6A4GX55_9AGAR|nr:hypothetical protein BT96DRAFT_1002266 [Gymnopus androsaceus JB14]